MSGFAAKEPRRKSAPRRICGHCGDVFIATQEYRGYAKRFCSQECCGRANAARAREAWPDEATIRDLYERQGLTDRQIGAMYGKSYTWVLRIRKEYGVKGHPMALAERAPDSPRRREPKPFLSSHGYIKIGDEYEHRIVAAQILGRPLTPKEVVHHRDGDKTNNDPANLEVFPSNSAHMRACHPNPPKRKRTKADNSVYNVFSLGLKGELFCRNCGDPARDLHHAIPRSMHAASRTNLLNGLPLCRRCHVRWHQRSIVIHRDVFTPQEWKYISSVHLLGQDITAWLDDRYPVVTNDRLAA